MGVLHELHEVLSLPVAADKVPHCQSLLRHIQWMAQKVHVHNTPLCSSTYVFRVLMQAYNLFTNCTGNLQVHLHMYMYTTASHIVQLTYMYMYVIIHVHKLSTHCAGIYIYLYTILHTVQLICICRKYTASCHLDSCKNQTK